MKRRFVAAVAVALAGLLLSAVPAASRDGHGAMGSDDWNIPLTNVGLL